MANSSNLRSGGQILIDALKIHGVDTVFCVPGESYLAALDALHDARDRFERDYILRALAAQQGNISRTAEALGIERSNLYRKMRAFGITPPRKAEEEDAV